MSTPLASSNEPKGALDLSEARRLEKSNSPWRQAARRFARNKLAVFGVVVLAVLIAIAILTPWITPTSPETVDLMNMKAPPSSTHILGTDELGRDVLARLMYGSRVSLSVGMLAMVIAVIIGSVIGSVAAFYGGWIDNVLMRLVDIILAFPVLFLLIIMASYIKPSVTGIMAIIGCTSWMGIARLVRGSILSLKEQDFTDAARALGAGDARIIFKHLLPNALGPIIVAATLLTGGAIIYESSLSYLGVGIQPPFASWGNMLTNAQDYLAEAPWLAFWPGMMIFITVLSLNFVGDGLRDAFDPKMKK